MSQKLIVIEGNIGSGKTTLCKKLAQDYQSNLILEEFEENPFLKDFLKNQKNNPLGVELQFLIDRFHQLKSAFHNNKITIADYFIEKSLIFSSNNLSDIEKQLFDSYYSVLFEKITSPDILIYLSVKADRLMDNIKKRGREIEQELTPKYLESIHNTYLNYIEQIKNYPVLIIEVSELDFVKNTLDYKKIKTAILKNYTLGVHKLSLK